MNYKIHDIVISNYRSPQITFELYDYDNWNYQIGDIFPIKISNSKTVELYLMYVSKIKTMSYLGCDTWILRGLKV